LYLNLFCYQCNGKQPKQHLINSSRITLPLLVKRLFPTQGKKAS